MTSEQYDRQQVEKDFREFDHDRNPEKEKMEALINLQQEVISGYERELQEKDWKFQTMRLKAESEKLKVAKLRKSIRHFQELKEALGGV